MKHNGTVDCLKFIFSMIVMIFHSEIFLNNGDKVFYGGNLSVEFFFIVSGYLLAQKLERDNPREGIGRYTVNLIWKKYKSFCPAILLAWGLGFIVWHTYNIKGFTTIINDLFCGIWEITLLYMAGFKGRRYNGIVWYISVMFLCMLIIVPLYCKKKDTFIYVYCPLITLLGLGYLSQCYGTLAEPELWIGFCYKGLIRGFSELCLGVICFHVCKNHIMTSKYTDLHKYLISIIQLALYSFIIVWMQHTVKGSQFHFVIVALFAIAITLTFSHEGKFADMFDNKVSYFLGKLSLYVYLGHSYWRNMIANCYIELPNSKKMMMYFLLVACTTAMLFIVSEGIKKLLKNWREKRTIMV